MIVALSQKWMRAGAIAAAVFLLIFIVVSLKLGSSFEGNLTAAFADWHTSIGDVAMIIFQTLGNSTMNLAYAFALATWLWISRLRIPALWVVGTMISGYAIGWIFKSIAHRPRPIGAQSTDGYSFPSGHSLATWLFVTIVFVIIIPNISEASVRNWVSFALVTFALLVMESRLYMGDHYLTDTLGGATLAYAWVVFTVFLYRRFAPELPRMFSFFQDDQY